MLSFIRLLAALVLTIAATAAPAQQEYTVRPGDVLSIEVLEDSSLNRSISVLPDGRFSFPFAGSVTAAGKTVSQIQASLTDAIRSNFSVPPNVFVSVQPGSPAAYASESSVQAIDIYFLGEVNKPGLIAAARGTTFLQALAQSGGLTPFAATKRIQLRRTDPRTHAQKVYEINYKALSRGATLSRDIQLLDGDVILVPERRLFE
ncbi:polysaccharide biosynthesis/export family protein [Rhodovulum visakhapatnamense]|uniref:Polysaccharide export outer membrane protein n=1 Tax=Rhodovulum visakhapatnamense TaxID=364297 RepID=A0A4V3GS56_9RHOB|nr:polysaccharide biosynthesis/export family protein [Rhodovulum visakhapatnamense]TDX21583.1 polysaccharide export outer membrane protein [Rhodovulum visakhapatnamense]